MRIRGMRQILAVPLLALAACSPLNTVDSLTPTTGYTVVHDVTYGEHPRQRLDLYQPTTPLPGAPVVVFFYGGGWTSGSKDSYRFIAQPLAEAGYRVAVPDYRLYPEVAFPTFLDDAAAAVAEVIEREGGPVVLMGHSAGAHQAVMLTLDPTPLAAAGVDVDRAVAGTVGLAGPYDFLPLSARYSRILAPDGDPEPSQPIVYARGDAPPLLLVHGGLDVTVGAHNSRRLAAAIEDRGGQVTLVTYPTAGHLTLIGGFAEGLGFLAPVRRDVLGWLDRTAG